MRKRLRRSAVKFLKRQLFGTTRTAEYILASNMYGTYCIPAAHDHRPAARVLVGGDVWEPETIEFITEHCGDGDVVTAGAWAGDGLPAISMATSRQGRVVWAFEPHPESYRCALVTILLNELNNVRLAKAGLGERSEGRELVMRDYGGVALGGASHIADIVLPNDGSAADRVTIDVVALDDIIPQGARVSIIQLDIEGFEPFALIGAKRTIEQSKPLLILETVPHPGSAAGEFLSRIGYEVKRPLDSENFLLVPG